MAKHQLNQIVINASGQMMKIVEIFPHWRFGKLGKPQPEQLLYHCRFYDLTTGLPMVCPDERCKGEHTCPIHGSNLWAEQIRPLTASDIAGLQEHGFIKD